jgi:hypothetical protein
VCSSHRRSRQKRFFRVFVRKNFVRDSIYITHVRVQIISRVLWRITTIIDFSFRSERTRFRSRIVEMGENTLIGITRGRHHRIILHIVRTRYIIIMVIVSHDLTPSLYLIDCRTSIYLFIFVFILRAVPGFKLRIRSHGDRDASKTISQRFRHCYDINEPKSYIKPIRDRSLVGQTFSRQSEAILRDRPHRFFFFFYILKLDVFALRGTL